MKRKIKGLIIFLISTIIVILSINIIVITTTKNKIKEIDEINMQEIDCILILGAGIRNNRPSPMLEDRLKTGIELYQNGISKKILVSGDHTTNDYDEVNVMKTYLKEQKIPSEDIFMDHAGISTYDSIYRAKNIFKVEKMIIVTQKYHLYRALYIANSLDIEVYGIDATNKEYSGQTKRDIREFAARIKDFIKSLLRIESTYLGEVFPINGSGDKTNDEYIK